MVDLNKMSQLQQLSNQLPVANSQALKQQEAARNIELQQAIKAAPITAQAPQMAGQLATAAAAQIGKAQTDLAQQGVQEQQAIARTGLEAQRQQLQQQAQQTELVQREKQLGREKQLADVSLKGKEELYDKQLEFKKDELGREYLNQVQLDDWALSKASSENDFRAYNQQVEQLLLKKGQLLDFQFSKISQEKQQQARLANQLVALEQDVTLSAQQKEAVRNARKTLDDAQFAIAQREAEVSRQLKENENNASNRMARSKAFGSLFGIAAGATITIASGGMASPYLLPAVMGGGALGGGLSTMLFNRN